MTAALYRESLLSGRLFGNEVNSNKANKVKFNVSFWIVARKVIYASFLLASSCVDPFDIGDIANGESRLVVDGMLTNETKAHSLRISYSSPSLRSYESEPVTQASVFIEGENGDRVQLTEENRGEYFTPPDFAGTVGVAYTLQIQTSENVSYRSEPEMMRPVAEIDTVFAEIEGKKYISNIGTLLDEHGLQFYLNTGTGLPESNFYRWEWEDTYEIKHPLDSIPETLAPPPTDLLCYQSSRGFQPLLLASSQNFTQDRIIRQPINFVSKRTYKLQRRYSLLVKQYSLTERAFNFWSDIEEQRNISGSLLDPPPTRIFGNIVRDDDPDETVLGYFQVSAVTKKRIFIERDDVPVEPGGPVQAFSICADENENEFPVRGADDPNAGPPLFCYDCRFLPGVTTERPSFW